MTKKAYKEKRNNSRLVCDERIELRSKDNAITTGRLRDLGVNSLYMYTCDKHADTFTINEALKVKLKMKQGKTSVSVDLLASVVRTDKEGVAVKFTTYA